MYYIYFKKIHKMFLIPRYDIHMDIYAQVYILYQLVIKKIKQKKPCPDEYGKIGPFIYTVLYQAMLQYVSIAYT